MKAVAALVEGDAMEDAKDGMVYLKTAAEELEAAQDDYFLVIDEAEEEKAPT